MKPEKIYTVYFSPTGTSRKAAEAVARGLASPETETRCETPPGGTQPTQMEETPLHDQREEPQAPKTSAAGMPVATIDLTHHAHGPVKIPHEAAAVIAVPVYGGRVAPTARKRLADVHGEGTPAVLVVLYGNRAFEGALEELSQIVQAQGFIPVAAAALIGEHSYSSARYPIAAGRPGAQDLAETEAFGRRTAQRLAAAGSEWPAEQIESVGSPQALPRNGKVRKNDLENATRTIVSVDVRKIDRPASGLWPMLRFIRFVLGYRRRQKRNPVVYLPATDAAACTHCGRCALLCPTGAIVKGDEEHTDSALCIRCCACVKGCPVNARTFDTPFAAALARNFRKPKPNVFLPR